MGAIARARRQQERHATDFVSQYTADADVTSSPESIESPASQGTVSPGHTFGQVVVTPTSGLRVQRTPEGEKTTQTDPTNQTAPQNTQVSSDNAVPTNATPDSQGSTTIQAPTVTSKSYSGATLTDVASALPDESGSVDFDFTVSTQGDPASSATLKVTQTMTLPTWAERSKQCAAVQKAWDDFASALRTHEDGHVAIDGREFASAHRRFVGKASSAIQTESDQLRKDVQKVQDDYDTKTDHGRNGTPPTTIDLSATCDSKKTSDLNTPTETPEGAEMMAKSALTIGAPDDPYEQEADRVADEVMGMETPSSPSRLMRSLQRKQIQRCACGGKLEEDGKQPSSEDDEPMCAECQAKAGKLQRKATADPDQEAASPRVDEVLASGGQPLPSSVRDYMEPRFGHDFSRVRVHTDERAAQSARAVNALAYTVGGDVVFAGGRYAPESSEGRRLLAHELTHVVQQGGSAEVAFAGQAAPTAGRSSIARSGRAEVQRIVSDYDVTEQKKLIEEGIRDKDIGKIKDVEPIAFSLATDSQAIDMIFILLNQGWVGPRDESAIYNIWNSRGKGVVDLASKYPFVWNMCLDRGVDTLWSIPDLNPVRNDFKQVVASKARGYLDDNKKLVDSELKRYGLDNMNAAPTAEQGQEREKMLQAAGSVQKAKDALGKMEHMLVGYNQVVGTPQDNKVQRCAAMFDPQLPPPQPWHVPVPVEEGTLMPSWDETKRNYERAHAIIDHYTRLYPALVALREDTDLKSVAGGAACSDEAASQMAAMQVMNKALADTMANITKTYGLVNDPKGEFALELQPIHEQMFTGDAAWKDPFKQMIARAAIKEHGNVEFWNTMGVSAVGLALFVVAEFSTGGLATFFFAAAAAGGIAQAAASWDKYFTLSAAAGTNLSKETSLISTDQASDQLLTATIDTVMAFVGVYDAAGSGAEKLEQLETKEAALAGMATKEEKDLAAAAGKLDTSVPEGVEGEIRDHGVFQDEVAGDIHEWRITDRGMEVCSPSCPVIGKDIEARATKIKTDYSTAGLKLEADVETQLTKLTTDATAADTKAVKLESDLEAVNNQIKEARLKKQLAPEDLRARKAELETAEQNLAEQIKQIKQQMSGLEREQSARLRLHREGYTENVFGTTDKEMQDAWGGGISPDMIKRNPTTGKIVIGEGKGEDFAHAVEQCQRGYDQLEAKGAPIIDSTRPPGDPGRISRTVPVSPKDIEVQVYTSPETYNKMIGGETIGTTKWGLDSSGTLLRDGVVETVGSGASQIPVKVFPSP